ncbi:MAG: S8 family serine peptidase [Mastigocoleus sp.]
MKNYVEIPNNALDIQISSNLQVFNDSVNTIQGDNFYRFTTSSRSSFSLDLSDLQQDADVRLIQDINGNQIIDGNEEVIAKSNFGGTRSESIDETLNEGTYYIQVYPYREASTSYKLSVSLIPENSSESTPENTDVNTISSTVPQSNQSIRYVEGNFWAETFTYDSNYNINIFSGNGSVNYDTGAREVLNLSDISSSSVNVNLADTVSGGVVYNPGDGARVFDAINFNDGRQILFESLDAVIFSDDIVYLSVTPNDPSFNEQSNLHMTSTHHAWRFTTGNENALVGIVDTGLGTGEDGNIHPDLQPVTSNSDQYLDEWSDFSHGTSVAGTIAAESNNGQGIAGINWDSSYYVVDVVGNDAGDEDLAGAVELIINQANSNNQKAVINLSLIGGYSTEFEQLVANNQNNALFVIASGNDNENTLASPANLASEYDNVLAVGASWLDEDWNGNSRNPGDRIDYSNEGWWSSNSGNGLTLMAPSEFTTTRSELDSSGSYHNHSYDSRFNGTSASTTMVSGIVSLLWSVNSNLTSTQIKSILSETATDVGAAGYDTQYGHGIINADKAMRRAIAIARGA